MPVLIQTICNGCGMVKKEANHWYTVDLLERSRPRSDRWARLPRPWTRENLKSLCGRRCVAQSLDRWMDRISQLTAPPSVRPRKITSLQEADLVLGGKAHGHYPSPAKLPAEFPPYTVHKTL
jgi:hypothetical protein